MGRETRLREAATSTTRDDAAPDVSESKQNEVA